jgi:hypothetical protein
VVDRLKQAGGEEANAVAGERRRVASGRLITKLLDEQGFWAKFPPDGIVVESWYVMMGLGHVATLRVPPARLREFNRSIKAAAWKAFRSEIYATYDFKEVAKTARERALKK